MARKSYVEINPLLSAQLLHCTNGTLEILGERTLAGAQELVPQPPELSARGRRRTGRLKASLKMIVKPGADRREDVSITTGPARNGYRYGAAVEGLNPPRNRPYTSTPFEHPAFEEVARGTPELMREQALKACGGKSKV